MAWDRLRVEARRILYSRNKIQFISWSHGICFLSAKSDDQGPLLYFSLYKIHSSTLRCWLYCVTCMHSIVTTPIYLDTIKILHILYIRTYVPRIILQLESLEQLTYQNRLIDRPAKLFFFFCLRRFLGFGLTCTKLTPSVSLDFT